MKFKDVTLDHPNIVATCSNNGSGLETVRIYEKGNTVIIYSFNDQVKHASLSNAFGIVKDSEIEYAVKRLMRVKPESVKCYISKNGVYHLKYSVLH